MYKNNCIVLHQYGDILITDIGWQIFACWYRQLTNNIIWKFSVHILYLSVLHIWQVVALFPCRLSPTLFSWLQIEWEKAWEQDYNVNIRIKNLMITDIHSVTLLIANTDIFGQYGWQVVHTRHPASLPEQTVHQISEDQVEILVHPWLKPVTGHQVILCNSLTVGS